MFENSINLKEKPIFNMIAYVIANNLTADRIFKIFYKIITNLMKI